LVLPGIDVVERALVEQPLRAVALVVKHDHRDRQAPADDRGEFHAGHLEGRRVTSGFGDVEGGSEALEILGGGSPAEATADHHHPPAGAVASLKGKGEGDERWERSIMDGDGEGRGMHEFLIDATHI
jgi:hypothetical protein